VTNKYSTDFALALGELQSMRQEREALETKIAKQIKKVAALHELAKEKMTLLPYEFD